MIDRAWLGSGGGGIVEDEGQEIGIFGASGQLCKHVAQPRQWLDAAGATGEHETSDDGARFGANRGVAETPTLPCSGKDPDARWRRLSEL
jgi:hypothetical protein